MIFRINIYNIYYLFFISPAKESGLIDIGDYLIGVNDIDLRSSTIDEIIALLNKDNDDYFNAELRLIFEYNDGCAHNFNETEINIRDTMSSNSFITAEASENFRKIIFWNNRDLGIIIEKTLNALDPVVDWLIPLDLQGNCMKVQSANFNSRSVTSLTYTSLQVELIYLSNIYLARMQTKQMFTSFT